MTHPAFNLTGFDRYIEEHGILEEDWPAAFALWIAEVTGRPVPRFEKVEREAPVDGVVIEGDDLWTRSVAAGCCQMVLADVDEDGARAPRNSPGLRARERVSARREKATTVPPGCAVGPTLARVPTSQLGQGEGTQRR